MSLVRLAHAFWTLVLIWSSAFCLSFVEVLGPYYGGALLASVVLVWIFWLSDLPEIYVIGHWDCITGALLALYKRVSP